MYYRYLLAFFIILSAGYCSAQNHFGKSWVQIRQFIVKNHIARKIQTTTEYDDKGTALTTYKGEYSFDSSGNVDEWIYEKEKFRSSTKFEHNTRGEIIKIIGNDSIKRVYMSRQFEYDSFGNAVSIIKLDSNGKIDAHEKSEYDAKNQLVKKFYPKKRSRNKFYLAIEYFYNDKAQCIVIKNYDEFKNLTTTTINEYDFAGNLVVIKTFNGKKITEFQENKYNERNLLIESYWPKGWQGKLYRILYTYDERDLEIEQKNYREDQLRLKIITTYFDTISTLNPQP